MNVAEEPGGDQEVNAGKNNAGVNYEASVFVVLMASSGVVAWQLGFEQGAFGMIDYRWFWLVWVLSVVALASSLMFRGSAFDVARPWQLVLLVPTIGLIANYFLPVDGAISFGLDIASAATLPLTLYIMARLLGRKFFTLSWRTQVGGSLLVAGVFVTGLLVGDSHPRYLKCYDFVHAGDYVPPNCVS